MTGQATQTSTSGRAHRTSSRRASGTPVRPGRARARASRTPVRPGRARSRHGLLRSSGLGLRNLTAMFPTKVTLSVAVVMIAAALVGVGTFATFTNTASVAPSHSSGTVTLGTINVNQANNRLSVGASNIAAGDTIDRSVNVQNAGSLDLASVVLTTSATASSLLDTDATNGLQIVIDKCSQAWTEGGTPPAYTYTCGGTTSSVLASRPVIGTNLALSNLTLTSSANNYLRLRLTLPSSAPNSLQAQSSTISFAFTATQRAATAQ